jgi:AcrR family transcriptional regulator
MRQLPEFRGDTVRSSVTSVDLLQRQVYPSSGARERIMEAAYDLFSRRGIRAVGIDAIISQSGVARMTLYRHFGSKEELVLAYLERREQLWTRDWLQAEVTRRATDPADRLLVIFDVFHDWFQRPDFEGCAFVNIAIETADDPGDRVHRAANAYLWNIRAFLAGLAREAGVEQPSTFAREWHILMKGAIVCAGAGDREAAHRAQRMARLVLADALAASGAR